MKEGRLAISPGSERHIIDEVRVQEQLTDLLLSYTPRWLQLGLSVVLEMSDDESIKVNQQNLNCIISIAYSHSILPPLDQPV